MCTILRLFLFLAKLDTNRGCSVVRQLDCDSMNTDSPGPMLNPSYSVGAAVTVCFLARLEHSYTSFCTFPCLRIVLCLLYQVSAPSLVVVMPLYPAVPAFIVRDIRRPPRSSLSTSFPTNKLTSEPIQDLTHAYVLLGLRRSPTKTVYDFGCRSLWMP